MPHRLITIGVSHFCEKARWALEHLGVPFREEPHAPLFHVATARRSGGGSTAPVLVSAEGQVLADSTEILRWADAQAADPGRRLLPQEPAARREVDELEELFDERLGPHTRRLAYYHLLDDPRLYAVLTAGVPRRERLVLRPSLPLVRWAMRKAMRIDAEGAARSRQRMEQVLDQVDELLADGRAFLAGARFSAADLTFAALLAPVVFPPEYGFAHLPELATVPPALQEVAEAVRARPAGAHALRIYAQQRRPGASA